MNQALKTVIPVKEKIRQKEKKHIKLNVTKEEAKEFILDFLKNGQKEVSEMDETAKAMGIKEKTLRRAKEDLKKDERIKIFSQGFRPKKWYAVRISPDDKG